MQIYSFVGDDMHLNWVIAVETFSTKKILLGIKKWRIVFTFPSRCTEKTTTYIHRCTSILRALKKQWKGTLWTMPINYRNLIANNLKYHLNACITKQPANGRKKSSFGEIERSKIFNNWNIWKNLQISDNRRGNTDNELHDF